MSHYGLIQLVIFLSVLESCTSKIKVKSSKRPGTTECTEKSTSATCLEVKSISLTSSVDSPKVGESFTVEATATLVNDSTLDIRDLSVWSVSSSNVLASDETVKGKYTVLASGSSVVTVTYKGKSAEVTVTSSQASVELTSLLIIPDERPLYKGVVHRYRLVGVYSDGTLADVTDSATWTVGDSAIAQFASSDQKGKLSLLSGGSTSLSAAIGAKSVSRSILVSSASLNSISILPSTSSMPKDFTGKMTAQGTYSDGTVIELTDSVTWSSSDTSIGAISNTDGSEGKVSAGTPGLATISASVLSVSSSTSLTVKNITLSSINISPSSLTLPNGVSSSLKAIGTFSDASLADITEDVTWSSSNGNVTVSNKGLVLGKSSSTSASITAEVSAVSASRTVAVSAATLASIAISPSSLTLKEGFVTKFKAMGTFSDSSTWDLTDLAEWSSSNSAAVAVDNKVFKGVATGVLTGTSNITAAFDGVSQNSSVEVNTTQTATLSALQVNPGSAYLVDGNTLQLNAIGIFSDSTASEVTNTSSWSTSDAAVATVNASTGLVTATGTGFVIITSQKNGLSSQTSIVVTPAPDTTDPTAGTFSASSGVSDTAFTLNWSAATDNITAGTSLEYFVCSGASAAAIDTDTECLAATQVMNWTANTLTKAITGKAPSTTYYYNVVVRDTAGNQSIYDGKSQATNADTTVPTAGTFSASTSVGSSGFTLNWSAATDNITAGASLEYFVCSGASAAAIDTDTECLAATQEMNWNANTLTKAITGKAASTTYYYNVVVRDAAGNRSVYNGKSEATTSSAIETSGLVLNLDAAKASGVQMPWANGCGDLSWHDHSTFEHTGTLNNFSSCGASSGWLGNGTASNPYRLKFDGSDDGVEIPASGLGFSTLNQITVGAWFKTSVSRPSSEVAIVSRLNAAGQPWGFNLSIETDGRVRFWAGSSDGSGTGTTMAYSASPIFPDTWTYAVAVVSGTQATVYLNNNAGTTVTRNVSTVNDGNQDISIGNISGSMWRANIDIANVLVYNRALSLSEIQNNCSVLKDNFDSAACNPPSPGTFSASTSVTTSSFTLNWTAGSDDVTSTANLEYYLCSGANAAAIDTVTECLTATQEMNWTANTLTKAISGKAVGMYHYNVVVRDAAGNKSIYAGKSQPTVGGTQKIFLAPVSNGNLGGLSGADSICQSAATAASLGGTWKAILSSETVNASSRITVSGEVNNIAGTKIFDDSADMFDGSWDANVLTRANGTLETEYMHSIYAGTLSNGALSSGYTCVSWTSSQGWEYGDGTSDATMTGLGSSTYYTCDQPGFIYCIDGQ